MLICFGSKEKKNKKEKERQRKRAPTVFIILLIAIVDVPVYFKKKIKKDEPPHQYVINFTVIRKLKLYILSKINTYESFLHINV